MNGPNSISGTFILSFDPAHEDDVSVVAVTRLSGDGKNHELLGFYTGEEAEWMYSRCINVNKEGNK